MIDANILVSSGHDPSPNTVAENVLGEGIYVLVDGEPCNDGSDSVLMFKEHCRGSAAMPKPRKLYVIAGIATTFTLLAGMVIFLVLSRVITPEFGLLSLVALLGIYLGFGVLFAAYHLTDKLE